MLGVGLADADVVGVADVLADADDDELANDADDELEADDDADDDDARALAAWAAADRAGLAAAAAARPPAHGSSTIPTDIRTTPPNAHVRAAREIRRAGERMVVLTARFGLGTGVMSRPPVAGAFWPGAWSARPVVIRPARERA